MRASEDVILGPLERKLVRTGIRLAVPEGFEAQVRPRSGLAIRHGIGLVNSPGTIDSDFRGEIQLIVINFGETAVELRRGERLAQIVISPVIRVAPVQVESLPETARGEGGFGSTGKD